MADTTVTINLGPTIPCTRCGSEFRQFYGFKVALVEGTFCSAGCADIASQRANHTAFIDYMSEREQGRWPSGWWILPAVILGILFWVGLFAGICR